MTNAPTTTKRKIAHRKAAVAVGLTTGTGVLPMDEYRPTGAGRHHNEGRPRPERVSRLFGAVLLALAVMALAALLDGGTALAATSVGNPSAIQIVDNGPADPYPSQLNVQNLTGKITDLNVRLAGYSHTFPDDVDVLLVGPQGQKALLMSNVGSNNVVKDIGIVLDDEAADHLPDDLQITDGVYKSARGTSSGGGGIPATPNFPSPAPAPPYADNLSVFDGTDPNGTWKLYVLDDSGADVGQVSGGWSLDVATNGPDVFTVDSTADTAEDIPDGTCSSPCTLREAIQESNATTAKTDTINFAIPKDLRDPTTGVATIESQSDLPVITDQVTINGYSQPGAHPNTKAVGDDASIKVELVPATNGSGTGLKITSSGSVIKGLAISRFQVGIDIGGDSVGDRIEGNFIGLDPLGTFGSGNHLRGVQIHEGPTQTVVGGTTPEKRNLISLTDVGSGVLLFDADANRVSGNYIGTDRTGTITLGNSDGVFMLSAKDNTIGGTQAGAGNIIANSDTNGVTIDGEGATGNRVLSNSISSNVGSGIELVGPGEGPLGFATPNDPKDADTGPNNLQNKPILSSARNADGKTTLKGAAHPPRRRTLLHHPVLLQPLRGERGPEAHRTEGRQDRRVGRRLRVLGPKDGDHLVEKAPRKTGSITDYRVGA